MHTDARALENTLATLKYENVISYYRIEDDGEKVTITVPVAYLNGEPNNGYDDTTKTAEASIGAALLAYGLAFYDGGIEDDGSGEYWIFRAKA